MKYDVHHLNRRDFRNRYIELVAQQSGFSKNQINRYVHQNVYFWVVQEWNDLMNSDPPCVAVYSTPFRDKEGKLIILRPKDFEGLCKRTYGGLI